ncbi:arginine deiminase family protein [Bacillus sonorensis]|nr:arginine deiminase family protein [Bacillus sonorensis]TWK77955.1 N(G),N(G)-dimethylarginine dimethylaminohydrolase [Bacillus paralicheniformis]ASB89746.1 Arginine deiminase [Bacillus sonorensis]MBG9917001.1 hypothetical protein [Bacillus sonorensis]MCZ0092194.1 arginine deiminase family protein [Bacillus sonorensis]MEC1428385.1 arginine deiminase family protein [Bacillus sonorensis]
MMPLPTQEFLGESMIQKSFHDEETLQKVWGRKWGVTNHVGAIQTVVLHRPGKELELLRSGTYEERIDARVLRDRDSQIQGYTYGFESIDPELVRRQHDGLRKALLDVGAEVVDLQGGGPFHTKSIYTRDIGLAVPGGVILTRFALKMREGEEYCAYQTFAKMGVPILGTIQGNGFIEGGSFCMLNRRTALIGRSVRVNQEGIGQLEQILSWQGIELVTVDLPADKIHLDEVFLMLDSETALVDPARLPYWFMEEMRRRGIKLLFADPEDPVLSVNCLAVSPGRVLFSADAPRTMEVLERSGIEAIPVDVSEIRKMGGGIHCSTLPLAREDM